MVPASGSKIKKTHLYHRPDAGERRSRPERSISTPGKCERSRETQTRQTQKIYGKSQGQALLLFFILRQSLGSKCAFGEIGTAVEEAAF